VRYFWLFIFPFIITSCHPDTGEWQKKYAKYKCDYRNLVAERDSSEMRQIEILKVRKDSIQNLIGGKFKTQLEKIKFLRLELDKVEKNYLAKHRALQDEQSLKHGHVATPDYDKKLQQLEYNRTREKEILIQKLKEEEEGLLTNGDYSSLKKLIEENDVALKNTKDAAKETFRSRLDSLQEKVNNHRINGRGLKKSLSESKATEFQALMDINSDPCKYVN
jgi:hypothetical protein